MYHLHGVEKYELPEKLFGVFDHALEADGRQLGLLAGFTKHFPMPVSRYTGNRPEAIATAIKATGFKVAAQTTSFKVAGMSCSGCESKLGKKFASIKGVTVDKVCAKSGHASVTYDPAKVKQADLAKAITDSGFEIK